MSVGVATFGPGKTTGIPLSGTFGGGSLGGADTAAVVTPNLFGAALAGGGGGGATAPAAPAAAPYVDPYADWGGKAGYDQAVNDYNSQRDSTLGSITDRIGSEGTKYNSSILDFLDTVGAGQRKIDAGTVQNELSKRQGSAGVLDKIGHGLQSGGVLLANRNATTSSAGDALARAWGDIGRREQTGVNNQYEQGKSGIADQEADLQSQIGIGTRHLGENKTEVINSIVSDAQTAIAGLNTSAASASLPDRIDIEQKKQEIRDQALKALQAYDASLTSGLAGIQPIDNNAAKTKAASLDTAGTAAANPFNYSTSIGQQFQGTGPFPSQLPIFTYGKKTDAATAGV